MNKALGWIVPIALGLLAAGLYFVAVRSATEQVGLVVVTEDLKAGEILTKDVLKEYPLRIDPALARSAIRSKDVGLVLGRRVGRPVVKGELLLFAHVQNPLGEAKANLRPDEVGITVVVPPDRITPGVRAGEEVHVVLGRAAAAGAADDEKPAPAGGGDYLGPFRVVGMGDRQDTLSAAGPGRGQQVVLAGRKDANGKLVGPARALDEARQAGRVVAIEFAGPTGRVGSGK